MELPAPITRAQDRLSTLLGCAPERRVELVRAMLVRNIEEATSYWLQLGVSVGIATLGLVVGSSAVIIGAMLVAPLMGPILALGMGLATGAPFLVLRAASRVLLSVGIAVGGSALVTRFLPYLELNAELAARTSPTLLDLITAAFCAMAGVYAAMRPGSDTATTAAGTSIGISLVPPLCVVGYGLGTASRDVAAGAALLFVTNFVAIVLVATLFFTLAGFYRTSIASIEREELDRGGRGVATRFLASRLARTFGSRRGALLRLLMPFALLAAVYFPLRSGLEEVAWQVGARSAVRAAITSISRPIVETRTRVERGQIEVVAVIVGSAADASEAKAALERQLRDVVRTPARVEMMAVPDATTFAGLEAELRTPAPAVAPPAPEATQAERVARARADVARLVSERWPSSAAGAPLAIELETLGAVPTLRVLHLGPPLGLAAAETLVRSLEADLGAVPRLIDDAVSPAVLERGKDDLRFVSDLTRHLGMVAAAPEVNVCVTVPRGPRAARTKALDDAVLALLEGLDSMTRREGQEWRVELTEGDCPAPEPTLAPPGAAPKAPPPTKPPSGG